MTDDSGPPLIAHVGYLPLDSGDGGSGNDDDFVGTTIFVNATEVAVLDVDLTC